MGTVDGSLLERYRHLLGTLDEEAGKTSPEEYLELLGLGEVDDLLLIRDRISEMDLSPEQKAEVGKADDLLMKRRGRASDWVAAGPGVVPIPRWGWQLDNGVQGREKAERGA